MNSGITVQNRGLAGFILEIPLGRRVSTADELFVTMPESVCNTETEDYRLISWGDPVVRSTLPRDIDGSNAPRLIFENISGHYYYLLHFKITGEIIFGNSLFGILPVYYCNKGDNLAVSDNAIALGEYAGYGKISYRFLLEMILFNYPISDVSIFESVKLLGVNSHIRVSEGLWAENRHMATENLFDCNPIPWKSAIDGATAAFMEAADAFLPAGEYASALTGGFDGRTLLAAGKGLGRKMTAFTFGTESSGDLMIASGLAASEGIPFRKILLDDDYIIKESGTCGNEFIINASGSATFARAHYLHAAKRLADEFTVMITGNFGSEIFRSPHMTGALISDNLVSIFTTVNPDRAIQMIESSSEFRSLNKVAFSDAWHSLKADIRMLPCFNPEYSGLTRNQQFYLIVFNEVFRKYFGAEMINQFRFIRNRTPFLDIGFLRVVFGSRLAGIHSDFFDHNPFKRYKGQVLYAHIIRNSWPRLGYFPTDKGYAPDDLLSLRGRASIAAGYVSKRLRKQAKETDPYAVKEAWKHNSEYWKKIKVPGMFFNIDSEGMPAGSPGRDLLFRIISLSATVNRICGEGSDRS